MGVPVRLSPTCSSSFSCLPLPWLLPAPSLRRALRPLRLLPMSMTPLAMSLSTIPYVHDATGDVADASSPEAEAYVHDATGDVAEPYVHVEPVVAPVVAAPAVTYAGYPYTYGAYPYLAAGAHVVAAP